MSHTKAVVAEMPPVHEAAELFPLIEGEAFTELVENIRQFGLREPIVMTSDGKLLDGRNRYRACLQAGKEPRYQTFRGPGNALQYVISANLHRRHLTTSQRSMIAANIAKLEQGARTDLRQNCRMSQDEAAVSLRVSPRNVRSAKKVKETGTPELVEAVRDGIVTVGAAVEAADLPPDEQRDVVRQVRKGVKASAAIAKKKTKHPEPPTPAPPDDATDSDIAPAVYEEAFLMLASTVKKMAMYAQEAPVTGEVINSAAAAAQAWTELVESLRQRREVQPGAGTRKNGNRRARR